MEGMGRLEENKEVEASGRIGRKRGGGVGGDEMREEQGGG